jgi:hypothetical protein
MFVVARLLVKPGMRREEALPGLTEADAEVV